MKTEQERPIATTAERALDAAERLVQLKGFNGFSYADVAAELKLTKASLHYHFPSKGELGEALIKRYTERFAAALAGIEVAESTAPTKLAAYAGLYERVLEGHRMCLCGMLAAEYRTLPEPMREAVIEFFDQNEIWLAEVLRDGREQGSLDFTGPPHELAQEIISTLEGALLISRPYSSPDRFRAITRRLLAGIASPARP